MRDLDARIEKALDQDEKFVRRGDTLLSYVEELRLFEALLIDCKAALAESERQLQHFRASYVQAVHEKGDLERQLGVVQRERDSAVKVLKKMEHDFIDKSALQSRLNRRRCVAQAG